MYAVCVTFEIQPGEMSAFLPLMHAQAQNSLAREPNCHQFDVCHTVGSETVFLYELYTDRAAFDAHLQSDHFIAFDRETSAMVAAKSVDLFASVFRPGSTNAK